MALQCYHTICDNMKIFRCAGVDANDRNSQFWKRKVLSNEWRTGKAYQQNRVIYIGIR